MSNRQTKQDSWHYQWVHFEDNVPFLFFDWIWPRTLDDFRGRQVFDAGCGPGHHIQLVAPVASHVTGMDLNTNDIAADKLAAFQNVTVLEGDIAHHQPQHAYDVVYCIGVIHHTDDPDLTFANLKKMCHKGSLLIIWCYAQEGNQLMWRFVEPMRKTFLRARRRHVIRTLAQLMTLSLYPLVYSVYLMPLRSLPYYEYFENFRKLGFRRNVLNVFDKLNAPQTQFISRSRVEKWFNPQEFEDISITPYKGVSWRASGIVKHDT